MKAVNKCSKQLFFFCALALSAVVSCKNPVNSGQVVGDNYAFEPPKVYPLVLTAPKKIDWKTSKTIIKPVIKPFDMDKLPGRSFADTTGFRPFKHPVKAVKLDYNALPSANLDISKIPAKPFKFKLSILNQPKYNDAGPPHTAAVNNNLLGLSEYQGLAGANIDYTLVDHQGFLWIATNEGLYRYDGQKLTCYFSGTGLVMYQLIEDRLGRIWVATGGAGIDIFDPKTGIILTLNHSGGLSNDIVYSLFLDKEQRVWAIAGGKINLIDPKAGTIKIFGKAQGLSEKCAQLTGDHNNNIWVTTGGDGVDVIDLENKKVKYIKKTDGLTSDISNAVLCDHKGRVWLSVGIERELNIFDSSDDSLKYVNEFIAPNYTTAASARIFNLSEDSKGNIWVASLPGVEEIDPEMHQVNNMLISPHGEDLSNVVFDIAQDKAGDIWFATFNGLFLQKQYHNIIKQIGHDIIFSLCEDDKGQIWQGDNNGVQVINRKTLAYKNISEKEGLSNDSVETIHEINNKIFVCTNGGLDIIDPAAKTIGVIQNGLHSVYVNAVLVDKAGNIWMGTNDGIGVLDPQKGTEKYIGKAQGLAGSLVYDMVQDAEGNIWVTYPSGGVDIIDVKTGTLRHLNNQPGLTMNGVKLFCHEDTANIWIGTPKGIYIASLKNKTLTSLSTAQGLVSEEVISLIQHNGKMYAATKSGVSIITPQPSNSPGKKWQVTLYGKDAGIVKINGSFLTDIITRDGLYWWGDMGLIVLDFSNKTKEYIPKPYITGLNLMDKPTYFADEHDMKALEDHDTLRSVNDGNYYVKGEKLPLSEYDTENNPGGEVEGPYSLPADLVLSHDQNYMQFHYTSLNLSKSDSSEFRYILEGADKQWSARTSELSTRNYFNLSPGKYTFKVEVLNRDGMWGEPASFSFTISPPWWQTWWGRVIFILIFIGIVRAFVYYRSRSLVREKRLLEEKVRIRTAEVMEQKEEIASQRDSLEQALEEIKTAQTQLIQREKLASLGELTAGIAHEIQNPLNFVNNFAEVSTELTGELKEELKKGNMEEASAIADDLEQNLQKIWHHGRRADFIVKGMLQHSRNSSNVKEPTNINTLADEFFKLSYHGLRAKDKSFNAEMVTSFDDKLPKINVVQQDVGRVLLNLFNNAFYAVQQKQKTAGPGFKPTVEVSTGAANGEVVVKVKDNGTGIPDGVKEKIMQPFFTTKPTGEGTGLGLSISYDVIVKGHGGRIDIDTKEGEYTVFTVSLPV